MGHCFHIIHLPRIFRSTDILRTADWKYYHGPFYMRFTYYTKDNIFTYLFFANRAVLSSLEWSHLITEIMFDFTDNDRFIENVFELVVRVVPSNGLTMLDDGFSARSAKEPSSYHSSDQRVNPRIKNQWIYRWNVTWSTTAESQYQQSYPRNDCPK